MTLPCNRGALRLKNAPAPAWLKRTLLARRLEPTILRIGHGAVFWSEALFLDYRK